MSDFIKKEVETKIDTAIKAIFAKGTIEDSQINLLKDHLVRNLVNSLSLDFLKERLSVIFSFEKNYLSLIKEFKEEIKFAGALQEDLRKERAKFFSEVLDDVSATLKKSQVDDSIAALWLKELVDSYTKSLDVSEGLLDEGCMDSLSKLMQLGQDEKDSIQEIV
ncbi:nickel transporter [Serratia fonticola]|uniref:nickel transporter n=1 Tax=Serratia fonticola TaxID=47917 RepID=UPI0034C6C24E